MTRRRRAVDLNHYDILKKNRGRETGREMRSFEITGEMDTVELGIDDLAC